MGVYGVEFAIIVVSLGWERGEIYPTDE